ncbi:MAG: FtsX-like permease family protein, partial [Pseudomonadota bacterium]
MNSFAMAWRFLRRDLTSGDLSILALALLVAVASMTAVGFFTDRIGRAVSQQASSVLAADLVLRSRRPITADYEAQAQARNLQIAKITNFPSVVLFEDATSLAEIKGVTETYPLRGTLTIAQQPFTPGTATTEIPGQGEAWATSRLMARLGASVGDSINVGRIQLTLTQVLDTAPDQGWQFTDFAPTLLINQEDVSATELITEGSRVSHRLLFAGSPSEVADFRSNLKEQLDVSEDLRSVEDAGPEIQNSLARANRFLGLASLVSVLLAAVAIAMAANSYAKRHLDSAALMKAFGAEQRFMQNISLYQMGMLSLGAGVLGGLIGYGAQAGLVAILGDMIGTELPLPSPRSGFIGFMIAVLLLTGFALPAFFQLKRVPPARVLRKDLMPIPIRLFWVALIALGAVSLLAYWLIGDALLLLFFGLGLLITLVALVLAGWIMLRMLTSLRGSSGVAWRYGLANVARRGRDSILQVVAFGLGLMVLLLLAVVRNDLLLTWQATLPEDAPNYFLINIQKDDLEVAKGFFADNQIEEPYFVPLIRARLTEVNNNSVEEIDLQNPEGRRFFNRESNLTFRAQPQEGNKVIAGEWWSEDPEILEVSVEEDFANDIEVELGDLLTFDIAG